MRPTASQFSAQKHIRFGLSWSLILPPSPIHSYAPRATNNSRQWADGFLWLSQSSPLSNPELQKTLPSSRTRQGSHWPISVLPRRHNANKEPTLLQRPEWQMLGRVHYSRLLRDET